MTKKPKPKKLHPRWIQSDALTPSICPLVDSSDCPLYEGILESCDGLDYCGCSGFSRWFWTEVARHVDMSVQTPIEPSKKET